MTKKDEFVPEALREVWEWKDSIYREVAHLPVEEGLNQILAKAAEASKHFPNPPDAPSEDDPKE